MRLQQFIAVCGLASRRAAERLIAEGRVTVNGRTATVGASIDPEADHVCVDGKPLREEEKVYLLLNKPKGVITSVRDTHGRGTALDCLDGVTARVYPVGRLDLDVEGALLMTNDGDLAYRLTHPKFEIEKVYRVLVRGVMTKETVARLKQGVMLEDGMTAPAKARILSKQPRGTLLELTIHEGRKREVKRMCRAAGHPVLELRRIAVGPITLEGLRPGEWRFLTAQEVEGLRSLAGHAKP